MTKKIDVGTILTDGKKDYQVEKYIDSGGFADVFRATSDSTFYAVKVLKYENDVFVNSIRNEFDIASKVNSNYAIHYYYFNELGMNGFPCFIIMEYANNGSLREELIKRKNTKTPFSSEEMVDIFMQLINGMLDINNIAVHRDIKPENILISDTKYKISDYGLAKYVDEATRSASKTMKGAKSKLYYAPELWENPLQHGLNDIKVDVYAMGIVFYEIANLAYPYKITSDYRNMHMTSSINPFNKNVDVALQSLICKMMEKKRAKRFETWEEIKDFLNGTNVGGGSKKDPFVENMLNVDASKKQSFNRNIENSEKERLTKIDAFKRLFSQIKDEIYYQLQKIEDEYNRNSVDCKIRLSKVDMSTEDKAFSFRFYSDDLTDRQRERCITFSFVALPNTIEEKDLLRKNFYSGGEEDLRYLLGVKDKTLEYKYLGQKLLLWGIIQADCGTGINVAVLEDPNDHLYGVLKTFFRKPNYQGREFWLPVDFSYLAKLCSAGFHEIEYTIEIKDFSFTHIQELIKQNQLFGFGSIVDPIKEKNNNFFSWFV